MSLSLHIMLQEAMQQKGEKDKKYRAPTFGKTSQSNTPCHIEWAKTWSRGHMQKVVWNVVFWKCILPS